MTCDELEEGLAAFALDEPADPDVGRHLAECTPCRGRAGRLRDLDRDLRRFPRELSRRALPVRAFPTIAIAAAALLFVATLGYVLLQPKPLPPAPLFPNPMLGPAPDDAVMHVVGCYMPENHRKQQRVTVEVHGTDRPIVLVVNSYFGVTWSLKIDPDARIDRIIVGGYFEQQIEGVPAGVPVVRRTAFPIRSPWHEEGYFDAWERPSESYDQMAFTLRGMTGLGITTFQGSYYGKTFTVGSAPKK